MISLDKPVITEKIASLDDSCSKKLRAGDNSTPSACGKFLLIMRDGYVYGFCEISADRARLSNFTTEHPEGAKFPDVLQNESAAN